MNNYHIYEEVGRGKYSVVYKGRKKKSIEYVAVKSVERSRKKKLMEEVSIFQQIENDHISSQQGGSANPGAQWHPNILKFYNWYETRNHFWVILEYCSGGDLHTLLEQDKKLPEQSIKKLAYELLEGLSYLHAQGIIFGDLKPSNVMVNEYCHLKLCDFSLAKKVTDLSNISFKNSAEERTSSATHASSKNKAGTPFYMAPELFQDNGVYSYYSDFWSLGCMLMEMATGKPPFYSSSLKELISKIMTEEIKPVDGFTVEFNDLLMKLLQKDPIYRVNWEELKKHPWWTSPSVLRPASTAQEKKLQTAEYKFTKRIYQPQLHFDKYLADIRGIDPQVFSRMRNQSMLTNMNQQILANQDQNVDVMRMSYNVHRNMQIQKEHEAKQSKQQQVQGGGQARGRQDKGGSQAMLGLMPNTPTMSKPAQHAGTTQGEFDAYNHTVKNRHSKLTKKSTFDKDIEDEATDTKVDFYGHRAEQAQPQSEKKAIDKNDFDLGQNTKMVLDFTGDNHDQEENKHRKINNSGSKPKSTSPLQNNFGQQKGATSRNPMQQNKFFATSQTTTEGPPSKINSMKASPSPKSLFEKKQSVGADVYRQQQMKTAQERQLSARALPVIPPKNIDRIQMLNDLDDDERMDDVVPTRSQSAVSQPVRATHEPLDKGQAENCVRMMKEMTLFSSPLSQAQVKAEVQKLVTQTVQIGPVQSQTDLTGNSSSSGLAGVRAQADAPTKATTLNVQSDTSLCIRNNPTQMKVPVKTIEQLIIHTSDTAVKPIVGNTEIERIVEQPYNKEHLQFTPWSTEQVLDNINTTQIESHLSDVYTSIASNTTINEKISTLQYFESIIINSNVSNSLINSVFMSLLKRMLEQIKSPMIKIRVCSVVGLLIRHSTMIDNDLAEIDIASQLIETLRDSNGKVRRRAIAALGEYMFYAATQLDDEMADPIWELSEDAIEIIVQSLDASEQDRIVRFYACKTLENICAQSTSAGHRFAKVSTVKQVLAMYLMEYDEYAEEQQDEASTYSAWFEGIRQSAAIALSHICKLNPSLFPVIFETITPQRFCQILMDSSNNQARVQQAFITMLDLALHNIYYPEISSILLREKLFLTALHKLLESQHIVIRGKCILTFLLLFKLDFRWITVVQQEIKFFNELDKLLKDNYKYVQCCLLCLADGIQEILPTVFKTVAEQLAIELSPHQTEESKRDNEDVTNLEFIRNKGVSDYGNFSDLITSQLYHITLLWDLQINPLIRSRVLSTPMVQSIASMIDLIDTQSFATSDSFLRALLIICENLSVNQRALSILVQPIVSLLVPVLFHKLEHCTGADVKFLSFKIYSDIITHYMTEHKEMKLDPINHASIEFLDGQIKHLLTNMVNILSSQEAYDPTPNFGLRLLSIIIENYGINNEFKQNFNKNGQNMLLTILSNFYQVSHPRLNKHTLKIMYAHLNTRQIALKDMMDLNILQNTNRLLTSMLKNRQEESLEVMLDILHELLSHFNELVKTQEEQVIDHINETFNNFESCIQLLSLTFDTVIVEKSSQCLIQMLQLFAQIAQSQLKKKEIYFVESHFPYLISALKSDNTFIQKRVLKCIYWALIQNEYTIQLTKDKIYQLETMMGSMMDSRDKSAAKTSEQILQFLTTQRQQQNNQGNPPIQEESKYSAHTYQARNLQK